MQAISLATLTYKVYMARELIPLMDKVGLHNSDMFDVSDCSGRHIFAEPWTKSLSSYAKVVKYHIVDIVACSGHRPGDQEHSSGPRVKALPTNGIQVILSNQLPLH
jgi:hypothetical protein